MGLKIPLQEVFEQALILAGKEHSLLGDDAASGHFKAWAHDTSPPTHTHTHTVSPESQLCLILSCKLHWPVNMEVCESTPSFTGLRCTIFLWSILTAVLEVPRPACPHSLFHSLVDPLFFIILD